MNKKDKKERIGDLEKDIKYIEARTIFDLEEGVFDFEQLIAMLTDLREDFEDHKEKLIAQRKEQIKKLKGV
jgi:hypothetical protein